jgi:hypothetical protein
MGSKKIKLYKSRANDVDWLPMQTQIKNSFVCLEVLMVNSLHGVAASSVSFSVIEKITDSA